MLGFNNCSNKKISPPLHTFTHTILLRSSFQLNVTVLKIHLKPILSYSMLAYFTVPYPTLPYGILSYPTLPYPILPYPMLSYLTLPYPT